MPDAPRKYFLINDKQLEAARQHWPEVSNKTWVLVMSPTDEPMVLNKAPHRGLGQARVTLPPQTIDGMHYRRDMDVLILVSGETTLASG